MTSRTFTPQVYLHSIRCSAWSGERYRRNPTEVHPTIGGERYALSEQLPLLLVRTVGQVRELTIGSNYAICQRLMSIVSSATQQSTNRSVLIGHTLSPERHLSVSGYAAGRDTTLEYLHKLLPVHPFFLTDIALRSIGFEAAFDRVQEPKRRPAVQDAVVEGDLKVHHAPDGDGVVHDDRTFDDRLGG